MSKKFTAVPQDTFKELQIEAGVLLKNFDPSNPVAPADSDIITATTGGITASCVPTYEDMFADVDNMPNNTKEGKNLTGWDCRFSCTALSVKPETIKMALGAADIGLVDESKVTPRAFVKQTDFKHLWFVGDKADGGMVAIKIKNALSTGGFSLKTTKNGKGTVSMELTGHTSIENINEVPMEFYATNSSEDEPEIDALTVTSSEGSTEGYTSITASGHTLASGEAYVYKVGTTAQDVSYGDDLGAWTDWNGSSDILATNGQVITVAVIDSSEKAVAVGHATVVANDGE